MTLAEKLTAIGTRLKGVLNNCNTELAAKGMSEVASLFDIPAAIKSIENSTSSEPQKVSYSYDASTRTQSIDYLFLEYLYATSPPNDLEWLSEVIFNHTDWSKADDLSYACGGGQVNGYPSDYPLINIRDFNVTSATNLEGFFNAFHMLGSITNINNKSDCNIDYMFCDCKNLHTVTGLRIVGSPIGLFDGCSSLVTVELTDDSNITSGFDVSDSPLLSVDSLVGFLNACSGDSIVFGSENIAKLSPEQIAIATNKNIRLT